MFDMDIMNQAEFMAQRYEPFESVQIFLMREGYDLSESMTDILQNEETWTLGNGWVVCELI